MKATSLRRRSDNPSNSHLPKNPHIQGDEGWFEIPSVTPSTKRVPRLDILVNYPLAMAIVAIALKRGITIPSSWEGFKLACRDTLQVVFDDLDKGGKLPSYSGHEGLKAKDLNPIKGELRAALLKEVFRAGKRPPQGAENAVETAVDGWKREFDSLFPQTEKSDKTVT